MYQYAVFIACLHPGVDTRITPQFNYVSGQNAIEHNDGPGHVAITLSLTDPSRFVLVVADDGPGMPATQLATLQNESFLSDDARTRGPGMGTLITSEIARRADWDLSYNTLEPHGLQVRLEGQAIDS